MGSKHLKKPNEPEELTTKEQNGYWTNKSVLCVAQGKDPERTIIDKARNIILEAVESGWEGPPYDPFKLAELMNIEIIPRDDVKDARLVPMESKSPHIEFNPSRPPARIRFSIAHELAHTLFPDYTEIIRMRGEPSGDDWQLELLCNMAAAEFLMPIGTAEEINNEAIDIDNLLRLRKKYNVSSEALFLRMVKITQESCAIFAAARIPSDKDTPMYRIDYSIPSRSWPNKISRGLFINDSRVLSDCSAVGFSSKGNEKWTEYLPRLSVECVGIPSYPGEIYPRVIGILRDRSSTPKHGPKLVMVFGDATQPRGTGLKIIAHVVNDRTPNWGGKGFAKAVKQKWDIVQEDFKKWAFEEKDHLTLGNTHVIQVSDELCVFHMIAQHGYRPSRKPKIRYIALENCLDQLAEYAFENGATVHMPRIGTGYAGGQWGIIREMIDDALVKRGIEVTIYIPPDATYSEPIQTTFKSIQIT